MAFFSELATNASDRHVGVVIYSGNDDPIVPHLASEGKNAHVLFYHGILYRYRVFEVVIQVSHCSAGGARSR